MEGHDYRISIIMPVYNVERYLRQSLDSVVNQSLPGIEIIAINDGSTDSSLSILNEYQGRYPTMIKVYTTENRGVSHARNYGLTKATGNYILFVDSDDFIEKDMCEKLYRKAVEDGNDIVICGRYNVYEREHIGEMKRDITGTNLINRNFKLADNRFEFAHISPFPWDKLIKRSLLIGMEFPLGIRFEDLVLIYQIVVKSECIGVLEEPLYNYRRTTQGGFLNSFSEQTLDIITAFQLVLDYMKKNNYMDMYHDELEYICARHFLFRYGSLFKEENKGKLEVKLKIIRKTQDFLDKEFPNWRDNHYLKYSSGNLKEKLKLYTSKEKMVRMTFLREYTPRLVIKAAAKAREPVRIWKRRLRKWKRSSDKLGLIKRKLPLLAVLKQSGAVYYTRMYETLKVEPKDILLESKHGEDVAGNIFALLMELSREEYRDYRIMLVMEPAYLARYRELLERYGIRNVTYIAIRTREYMRALATAKYLVTDTSFPPYFIKRKEQVYLNTWHGTPLKAMGRIVPAREYALGNVQRNFLIADYLLYQNEFSREVFQRDYMLKDIYPGTILLSGYPRNSVFFQTERYRKLRKECRIENTQVIVYMPTWRGLLHQKETDKQLEQLGSYFAQIDSKLTQNQVFYVKLHPYVKDQLDYSGYRHIREFPEDYETYDFLNASDILVTDYSSIMFDYAVTQRKIILFTYDREEYLTGRGLYLDIDTLELPKADTVDELIAEINRKEFGYPEFHRSFCSYDSANTPKQICEILLYGHTGEQNNLRVENAVDPARRKLLLFTSGMKHDDRTRRIIGMINSIDNSKFDVFAAMKADNVKNATDMLTLLKKEVGYFPINYEINYTRMDYILCKLYLKFGLSILSKRVDKVMEREMQKYFGQVAFDIVIHHSELDRMIGHMCSMLGQRTVYNFKYFNYDKYREKRSYRRQVKYFIKRFPGYDLVVATKEWKALNKAADNILLNEEGAFPVNKVLKKLEAMEEAGY